MPGAAGQGRVPRDEDHAAAGSRSRAPHRPVPVWGRARRAFRRGAGLPFFEVLSYAEGGGLMSKMMVDLIARGLGDEQVVRLDDLPEPGTFRKQVDDALQLAELLEPGNPSSGEVFLS